MPLPANGSKRARGIGAWAARWWRAALAELVGTALLVWLGLASTVPLAGAEAVPLAHPAMAFGLVVVALCVALGSVSGAHLNPAVTLAALATRRLRPAAAAAYAAAQVLGGVLGFAALQATLPLGARAGCTAPAAGVAAAAALALEAALTALLVLACCATWAAPDSRPDPAAPIKIGLVVAGLIYAGGKATGASLNPARSFGPALLNGYWDAHWVYWVGPLGGSLLAVLLHRVLSPPAPAPGPAPAPEDLPLTDKP